MSQRAEELLKRLVDTVEQESNSLREVVPNLTTLKLGALHDARAYLARERGPVAEAQAEFYKRNDGTWLFVASPNLGKLSEQFKIRVEVPKFAVLEGEVAEGDAR